MVIRSLEHKGAVLTAAAGMRKGPRLKKVPPMSKEDKKLEGGPIVHI